MYSEQSFSSNVVTDGRSQCINLDAGRRLYKCFGYMGSEMWDKPRGEHVSVALVDQGRGHYLR